ncbi:MAG: metal-sulfur cluster assembly factor [Acidimicrobiia bacterium]
MTEADVREALAEVIDPELDRPLVDLGFVTGVTVDGGRVEVELRLPTYWCSPNFSWLMASDVREALLRVPEVAEARVTLQDHHASRQISEGVNAGRSFGEVFGADADCDLEGLRRIFRRKALVLRQDRLLSSLTGPIPRRVAELPDTPEARAYLAVRAELGIDCSPEATAVVDADGSGVDDLEAYRRRARVVRVGMDGNTALCRTLFETRYATEGR